MEKIQQWALTVSAVSVISGILLSVIPGSKIKSAYKALISILLVYAFMLPLLNTFSVGFVVGDYIKDNYKVSKSLDKYALKNAVSSAEKAVKEVLDEYFSAEGIKCDFFVSCGMSDGEITLNRIIISNADKNEIIPRLMALGFKEDIIEFKGEKDERR